MATICGRHNPVQMLSLTSFGPEKPPVVMLRSKNKLCCDANFFSFKNTGILETEELHNMNHPSENKTADTQQIPDCSFDSFLAVWLLRDRQASDLVLCHGHFERRRAAKPPGHPWHHPNSVHYKPVTRRVQSSCSITKTPFSFRNIWVRRVSLVNDP